MRNYLRALFLHSARDAEQGGQEGEQEIPKHQTRKEATFTEAAGGTTVDDELGNVTQQEQEGQGREIIGCIRDFRSEGECWRKEEQGDEAEVEQPLRPIMRSRKSPGATTMFGDGGVASCLRPSPLSKRRRGGTNHCVVSIDLH